MVPGYDWRRMRVPASPYAARSRFSGDVITQAASGLSLVVQEADAGFDLGFHAAGCELAFVEVTVCLVDGQVVEKTLVRLAEVEGDAFDAGADQEEVSAQARSQEAAGEVLVDDGRDAAQFAGAVADDGDAAAACRDDDPACGDGVDEWRLLR